ncbi:MAG: heavy metal transporter [Deltaproteobacteria bacterium]|nr:MAG: heavy metal transporter [Deltaproteobacteria bacterium]
MNTAVAALERNARLLAMATIAWNVIEGGLALWLGYADESLALMGFGLDSWVEVASAVIVLRKLQDGIDRERERAGAKAIAALLTGLGVVIVLGGLVRLASAAGPDTGLPGVVLGSVSAVLMLGLWRAKLNTAQALDSRTLELDAACSRGCLQLSVVLLAGSALVALAPALWWADAVAAIVLGGIVAREGREGWVAANAPEFDGGCGCH